MSFTSRRISRDEKPSGWEKTIRKTGPLFIKLGILLGGLYNKWKVRKQEDEAKTERVRVLKKSAVILFSVLLGLILLAGTVKALVELRILTLQNFFSIAGTDLPADENGFTNLLLLGVGDKNHDGVDLTDSIIVVSLDPKKTRSAVMLSLPRDLYVLSTEKMGKGRLNELYRNEKIKLRREGMTAAVASDMAMKELAAEIGRNLGIPIHHVTKVDFIAFVDVVNILGGLDIDVPYDIVDTEYPGPNYSYQTFEIRKGMQHIDGETALKYARSRHTTSDFGRSVRQQQLLTALADKARADGIATSPGKISQLLKVLSEHVETTLTVGEMVGAGKMGDRIDRDKIISMNLNLESGYGTAFTEPGGFLYTPPREQFDGASVLLPISLPEYPVTWKQIKTFVRVLLHHRAILLSKPQITILNASSKTGLARALGNELMRYGFTEVETGNANDDRKNPLKLPLSAITPRTEADADVAGFFASLLQVTTGPFPTQIDAIKQGQITIVMGEDYQYVPFQDLLPNETSN